MVTCLSLSSHGKSRSLTWKKYSTKHCDHTVTDVMYRFVVFRSLHQGQLKRWSFVADHHHLENQGQRPGKITPPTTVTKQQRLV